MSSQQEAENQTYAGVMMRLGKMPKIIIDEMDPELQALNGSLKEKVMALVRDREEYKQQHDENVRAITILREALRRKRDELKETEAQLEIQRIINRRDIKTINALRRQMEDGQQNNEIE